MARMRGRHYCFATLIGKPNDSSPLAATFRPPRSRLSSPTAFAFLLSASLVAPAWAETPSLLGEIIKSGTLRVGLTEDYRPFSFTDASGKVEGIDVDMGK